MCVPKARKARFMQMNPYQWKLFLLKVFACLPVILLVLFTKLSPYQLKRLLIVCGPFSLASDCVIRPVAYCQRLISTLSRFESNHDSILHSVLSRLSKVGISEVSPTFEHEIKSTFMYPAPHRGKEGLNRPESVVCMRVRKQLNS